MANTYKNIVITPNTGSSTGDPTIVFSGGDTVTNTDISLRVYPTTNGTLSFEGSAGQLFSITNDLTNTIFSVADISGIPLMEVNVSSQQITFGQFYGNVGIGTANAIYKLDVNGAANIVSSTLLVGGQNVLASFASGNNYAGAMANSGNVFTGLVYTAVNSVFAVANAAYTSSNADFTVSNAAFGVANAAFAAANAEFTFTNTVYAAVNSVFGVSNAAFTFANGVATNAAAAFAAANAEYTFSNTIYAAVNSAFAVINAAYTSSNADYTVTNAAFTVANAAFGQSNTEVTRLSAAYVVANAAFGVANNASPAAAFAAANQAGVIANAAFSKANSGAAVNVSSTGPTGNTNGSLWWNSNVGRLLIYYNDGDSSQWVESNPSPDISGALAHTNTVTQFMVTNNITTMINVGYTTASFNAGANVAAYGTWTPNPTNGNYQYATSNGSFTLAAPSQNCGIDILVTNGVAAGSITFSGFTVGSPGTYATTNGNRYILTIRRINNVSTYSWYALQ